MSLLCSQLPQARKGQPLPDTWTLSLSFHVSAKVEWQERHTGSNTFGDHSHHLNPCALLVY